MANPTSISYTTTGTKTPYAVDWITTPTNLALAVVVPGGSTVSMTVEGTYDDVNSSGVTPDWITITELGTVTATKDALIQRPYQYVRANIASISGGPVRFKISQGMAID